MKLKIGQNLIDYLRGKKRFNNACYNDEFYFKANQLAQMRNEIEDLFLGLSYGQYGINPKCFEKTVFNLCCPSVDLYSAYKMYSYFCDFIPNLKRIFVVCAFYSAGFNLSKTSDAQRLNVYEMFLELKHLTIRLIRL